MCAYRKRRSGEDSDPKYVPVPAAKKAKTTSKITPAKQSSTPKLLLAKPYAPKITNGSTPVAKNTSKLGTSAQSLQKAVTLPATPSQASEVDGDLVDPITVRTSSAKLKDGSASGPKSSASSSKNGRITVLQAPTTPTRGSSLALRFNKNARPDQSKPKIQSVKKAFTDTCTPAPTHQGPTTPSVSENSSTSSPPETPTKQLDVVHNDKKKIAVSASALPPVVAPTVSMPDHVFNSLDKHAGQLTLHNIASWNYMQGAQQGIGFGVRAVKDLLMDELKRFGTMLGEPVPLGRGFTDRFQQAAHIDHPNSPFDRIAAKAGAEQFLGFERFFQKYVFPELDAQPWAAYGSGPSTTTPETPLLGGPSESGSSSGSDQRMISLPDAGTDFATMNNMQRSTSSMEPTGISGTNTTTLQAENLFPTFVGGMQRSNDSVWGSLGATSTDTRVVRPDHALPVPNAHLPATDGKQGVHPSSMTATQANTSIGTHPNEQRAVLPDSNFAHMDGFQLMNHAAATQLRGRIGKQENTVQQETLFRSQESGMTSEIPGPGVNIARTPSTAGTNGTVSHPFTHQHFAMKDGVVDHRERGLDLGATTEGRQESMRTPSLVETESGRAIIKV